MRLVHSWAGQGSCELSGGVVTYTQENGKHMEHFQGSNNSIVPQEVLQFTSPPVFSSNNQCSTPHSPSAMLRLTCQRQSWARRPFCRQQVPRPTFCSRVTFFGRLQHRPFWTTSTVTQWPSGDFCYNRHVFSGGLFLLGPYNSLQIQFSRATRSTPECMDVFQGTDFF